jgi:hypothetical protein
MQNLSEDEQKLLRSQVEALKLVPDISNEGKCLALGLLLVTVVGDEVLDSAILALSSAIGERGYHVIDAIEPSNFDVATLPADVVSIVVKGRAFVPESKVRLNGRDLPTTFIDPTQLTAELAIVDLVAPGQRRITVFTSVVGESKEQLLRVIGIKPAPVLSEIHPPSIDMASVVGAESVSLAVTGENFSNDSKVRLDGREQRTIFVETNNLTAQLPATELAQPGEYQVTVFTPTPGGGESLPLTFTVAETAEPPGPPAEAPAPVLEVIDPASVELVTIAANGSVGLNVSGQNFVSESMIRLDGLALTTIFGDATQLTAQLDAAVELTPGDHQVSVFTPAPGGGESPPKTLQIL